MTGGASAVPPYAEKARDKDDLRVCGSYGLALSKLGFVENPVVSKEGAS